MFDIQREKLSLSGRELVLETGRIARQADGAVLASWGETTVLATVVAAKSAKPGQDFFPLTVHYQEKAFAAGRIPGGFLKREGRLSDKETLTSRLIDRPIRPLFPDDFRCETQIIVTVLSHDMETDPDILAMIAASAALTLSGVPFMGPIGGARVGYIKDEIVVNPTLEQLKDSVLDLVVAGTADAVLMVESEAKELSEETMLKAVMAGHASFQPVIKAIIRLAEKAAKEPRELATVDKSAVEKAVLEVAEADLRAAYSITHKQDRYAAVDAVKAKVEAAVAPEGALAEFSKEAVAEAFHSAQAKVVRWNILDHGRRIDGRDLTTVRPIVAEVGVLPRAHGSALFTRGETQALVVATLGTGEDEQFIDALEGTYKERFLLHYNFPPYSVGETGRMGAPGRREIGHGKLAWRAIHPMLPTPAEFPYTIRAVSEITERLVFDGDCLRLFARVDGCGRSVEAPDRGHRDGPHPGRNALRRAFRHPRRRGSPRRYGLQSRRHHRGGHLVADGHQDRRHHRGDHEAGARPGQGRPSAYSRRDVEGDHWRARRARRIRAPHRDHEDPDRQDP
jgi:polyribonucleotide nucleotidyltransferase